MHTLLEHDGHIPEFTTVTDAKTHESRVAKALGLPPAFSYSAQRSCGVCPGHTRRASEYFILHHNGTWEPPDGVLASPDLLPAGK